MNSAFFYREQKAIFVVGSLTVWFALLALFGPYLPANNARASVQQVAMNTTGHEITGEWVRKGEHWTFRKIVSLKKIKTRAVSKKTVAALRVGKVLSSTARGALSEAPATTASITATKTTRSVKQKGAAQVVRQKLADEIGRWAKIGDRWEWSEGGISAKAFTAPKDELLSQYSRWQRRGGFWVFDVDARAELFLDI